MTRHQYPADGTRRWRPDFAVGLVHSFGTRLTVNAEYGYAGRGIGRAGWDRWFGTGAAADVQPHELAQLWYLRSFAAAQQEPLLRNRVLLRADVNNVFGVKRLVLSGHVLTSLAPASSQYQLALKYAFRDSSTAGLYLTGRSGPRSSEFGSTARGAGALLSLTHHF